MHALAATLSPTELSALVLYPALMGLLVWWVFQRRKLRREGKFPLGEDVLVVRRAGEHLSQELDRMDGELENRYLLLMVLPLAGFFLPFVLVKQLAPTLHWTVLIAPAVLPAAGLVYGLRQVVHTMERMRDTKLGLFGERVVADCLAVMADDGYGVFHDVPCQGATGKFNLDHVVVGGGVVTVVETKTYRKRATDNGESHKMRYEGDEIVWPTMRSRDELEQVQRNAEWLRKELKAKLNLDVKVHAALTFPGWFVNGGPPDAAVLVENPKRLPSFIRQRFSRELTPSQEDLVKRHLRSLCTNVDYETA